MTVPYPKIELHVHLEGAVRPADLLRIARRNRVALPVDDEAGLAEMYRFRDFEHFVQLWFMTTAAIQTVDKSTGKPVVFDPEWPVLKLRALACYESQIALQECAQHFLSEQYEYYAL